MWAKIIRFFNLKDIIGVSMPIPAGKGKVFVNVRTRHNVYKVELQMDMGGVYNEKMYRHAQQLLTMRAKDFANQMTRRIK